MKKNIHPASAGILPSALVLRLFVSVMLALSTFLYAAYSVRAEVIYATEDAFVKDGTSASNNTGSNTALELAARGTNNDRKIYLGFDLSSVSQGSLSGSSLNLTLNSLLGTATGAVSVSLYGITDNTSQFSESTITWNNAPKNNTASANGFSSSGVSLLGTISIDSSSSSLANTTISFGSEALSNYLSWAIGNLGDYYGMGATSAANDKITLMLSITDGLTTPYEAGFSFYSSEASVSSGYLPQLLIVPEPGAWTLFLPAMAVFSMASLLRARARRVGRIS